MLPDRFKEAKRALYYQLWYVKLTISLYKSKDFQGNGIKIRGLSWGSRTTGRRYPAYRHLVCIPHKPLTLGVVAQEAFWFDQWKIVLHTEPISAHWSSLPLPLCRVNIRQVIASTEAWGRYPLKGSFPEATQVATQSSITSCSKHYCYTVSTTSGERREQ